MLSLENTGNRTSEPQDSITALGHDVLSMKLYLVSLSFLWFYEYFLTLEDEITYGWVGKKTFVFWLYLTNRYVCPAFIIINLVADFAPSFTPTICSRYAFMEVGGIMILTLTAEAFLTLRVYAITHRTKAVLYVSGTIVLWQWAIAIYVLTQTISGSDDISLLLSHSSVAESISVELPVMDTYRICLFISILQSSKWVDAWLCITMIFDCLTFFAIVIVAVKVTRRHKLFDIMRVLIFDGVLYFFVLLTSNLMWLFLFIYGRPGLRFMHDQPAMIVSSIMINRICINLKKATRRRSVVDWGLETFETVHNTPDPALHHNADAVPHGSSFEMEFRARGSSLITASNA